MQKDADIRGTDGGSITVGLPPSPIDVWLSAPSHIYFIYSAGRVKIGYSTNWRSRVDQVCRGCSHPAELILVIPGDRQWERDCHNLFAAYREGGEWFRCEGKVREFLERFASPDGREILETIEADYAPSRSRGRRV